MIIKNEFQVAFTLHSLRLVLPAKKQRIFMPIMSQGLPRSGLSRDGPMLRLQKIRSRHVRPWSRSNHLSTSQGIKARLRVRLSKLQDSRACKAQGQLRRVHRWIKPHSITRKLVRWRRLVRIRLSEFKRGSIVLNRSWQGQTILQLKNCEKTNGTWDGWTTQGRWQSWISKTTKGQRVRTETRTED